eukprot:4604560-Karenia_brevis.AAC.1
MTMIMMMITIAIYPHSVVLGPDFTFSSWHLIDVANRPSAMDGGQVKEARVPNSRRRWRWWR